MVLSITALSEPVGTIKPWLRATNTIPIPPGWLICDGSTVVDSTSPYNGKVLPDFRGRFMRGHATLDNSNFSADTVYFAGGTIPNGGADTVNLNHAHGASSHSHSVSSSHTHTISTDNHTHNNGQAGADWGTGGPVTPWSLTSSNYSHSHGGATGSNTGFSTDSAGGGTDAQLSSATENRPSYRELVVIIKVK